ncbi:hypothetical protein IE992_13790 [Klebsiella pneumoniae]|uniref:Uncharacterized protein n=1 Tax=Klebsiella pneumoniae TaxID=573 RepID=A0A927DY97_KLEPN|nr:hypothetical protein [Klebsiella pneumoniae]
MQTVVVKLAQDGIGGAGDFARRVDIFNTNTPDTTGSRGLAGSCRARRSEKPKWSSPEGGGGEAPYIA